LNADRDRSLLLIPRARDRESARRMNGGKRDLENPADLWRGPDDELLSVREAAVLLTVKQSTLLSWAREGRVPVLRLGPRHLRWTRPLLREIRDAALDPGRRI
jgi:excisionase family DNA binding protein